MWSAWPTFICFLQYSWYCTQKRIKIVKRINVKYVISVYIKYLVSGRFEVSSLKDNFITDFSAWLSFLKIANITSVNWVHKTTIAFWLLSKDWIASSTLKSESCHLWIRITIPVILRLHDLFALNNLFFSNYLKQQV